MMLAPAFAVEELVELLPVAVPVPVVEPEVPVAAESVTPEAPAEEVAVARTVLVDEYCEARAQYWVTRPW